MKPLHLNGVPMRGPLGNNIEGLLKLMNRVIPPRLVAVATISHNNGCPCVEDGSSLFGCTCETVDLKLEAIPKEKGT